MEKAAVAATLTLSAEALQNVELVQELDALTK